MINILPNYYNNSLIYFYLGTIIKLYNIWILDVSAVKYDKTVQSWTYNCKERIPTGGEIIYYSKSIILST